MSVRVRAALVGAAFLLVALLWFLFFLRPNNSRVAELKVQQQAAQAEQAQLRARLERLKQLQRDEPRIRAELARLEDALPPEPRIPDFILQVQEAANLSAIPFLSISPSLPASFGAPAGAAGAAPPAAGGGALQAITVAVNVCGKYFELEDFIVRMERLPRAVRVNSFSLAPGGDSHCPAPAPGGSPEMTVTFSMQMFMSGPVAGAPAVPAPATPVPAATPPGATPGVTPAGGVTPASATARPAG